MAEGEPLDIFDATKKKKKKKKTPFDLDAALGETAEPAPAPATDTAGHEEAPAEPVIDDDINLDLETFGKKKKKKKAPLNLDDLGEALPAAESKSAPEAKEEAPEDLDLDLDMDFSMTKKKKKKKKDIEELVAAGEDAENEEPAEAEGPVWVSSDRDYTYDELLTRVFDIMREKNPDMVAGEKRKFVMRPPQVVRLGAKKSSFVNFADICKMLHRQPQHLLNFLFAELGTSGSVDGTNQLIIKGRFQQKQIETVLRRYIREYVTCHTCRSPDTILQKDTRLFFLQCESCGSRCTVASIKSGFQAVTGKRSVLRAKAS
ncbi:eukaryotic translation initiation factor 2 subunit 2-like [Pollicipes pollicipes]|uniref:eukaryotic translation initiation factor 2 subunit 2-like n=1 Tax=Pollicipes pollicipes TaxID=41117 RepID=UPI0018851349|nr:eukaryotic translation initiation factor 2 subunit 2-like [Pollicipes pollicipes]